MWINCIIPVKTALIDEVSNKSTGLAKGNMAGLGIGGYCEKIGEKKELDRFSTKCLSDSKGTCKILVLVLFLLGQFGIKDFDCMQQFVALFIY